MELEIVLSQLEKYAQDIGQPLHCNIDISSDRAIVKFVAGKYETHSSLAVLLSFTDMYEILRVNDIIGVNDKVEQLRDSDDSKKEQEIDEHIYITLAKYISQMLNASVARILFDDIVPLPKHKKDYFKSGS